MSKNILYQMSSFLCASILHRFISLKILTSCHVYFLAKCRSYDNTLAAKGNLLVHCHARCHQLSRETWVLIRNLIPTSLTSVLGLPISFPWKGIMSVLDLDISFRLFDRSGTRYTKRNMDSFPDRFDYLWMIMFSFSVWLILCKNYMWVIRLNEEDSQKKR